jgi:ribosomal protein L23
MKKYQKFFEDSLSIKIEKELKNAEKMLKTYTSGEMHYYWNGVYDVLSDLVGKSNIEISKKPNLNAQPIQIENKDDYDFDINRKSIKTKIAFAIGDAFNIEVCAIGRQNDSKIMRGNNKTYSPVWIGSDAMKKIDPKQLQSFVTKLNKNLVIKKVEYGRYDILYKEE